MLRQQGRHELVEKEIRQHLAADPNDGFALAVLAEALLGQEKRDEAEEAAREAAGQAPDMAFAHYALARVLSDRNRTDEAATAIREAIRLEPTDADYHGIHSAIEFERHHWKDALAAAETGLQFDPEHVMCNNVRAMALVKLGRKSEAGATIERNLARDPDNAHSHANQGWTLLEHGRRKEAMTHFRESLRLDPTNDWARAGLVEAIKAGNPIYAVMLKYFLWMQKLSPRARWGIVLGGYFGSRFLGGFAKASPALEPWATLVTILYFLFAMLTWLAHPLFNLALFLHPMGRHALNRDQRLQAIWVGLCVGLALGWLTPLLFGGHRAEHLVPAVVFGLLSMPTAAIFACDQGWPRATAIAVTLALAGLGGFSVVVWTILQSTDGSILSKQASTTFNFFLGGILLSQFGANWLMAQRAVR